MNIMITGAAGGYGSYAINFLKEFAPNDNIIALVRDNGKKADLEAKGFEVRVADYSDLSGMTKAMEGVDRLLFVSVPVFDLQKNVVEAAKASGVKYIAYTSICEPQYHKFGLEINHKQTEELIRQTGIPHTFLRNGWYLEMMMPYLEASAKMGAFPYYAGDAKVA
ncbi:MAG: NmrA family NAD(P)-binding protein [Ruminococcus sp.]|uniref:NAD(P)H-binding protein n=1 Tax=Ruminococcus sp. TaxID=41978 RepID=UPI0025F73BDE|nr:NAD(P)H-binding protein [Ruminococcus sp.]MBR5684201.1 NmrA family NAD(P)-binding protein [Ruminococcus sp.]